MKIYVESDNLVTMTVTDADGAAITDADVNYTLTTEDGQPVPEAEDILMSHQGGGTYAAYIEDDLPLQPSTRYYLTITARKLQGVLTKKLLCLAVYDNS